MLNGKYTLLHLARHISEIKIIDFTPRLRCINDNRNMKDKEFRD